MTSPTGIASRFLQGFLVAGVLAVFGGIAPLLAAEATQGGVPKVVIDGLEDKAAENVRAILRLAAEPCDAPSWRLRRLFQAADGDIKEALWPFGYYAPRAVKGFSAGEPCWSAHFTIDPGPRLHWSRIDIQLHGEAASDLVFTKLLSELQPKVGEPINHADYEAIKAEILLVAAKRGYRDGHFTTHALRLDPQAETAEAILYYDSGPRYRFGEVHFDQDAFDPAFVQRFSQSLSGEFYEAAAVGRLQRSLMDSGLFSTVDVKPDFGPNPEKQVPVNVRLVPRKRHAYLAGIGLTTDEGPRLRLGYENRRFNSRGHSGEAALRASSVRSNLDFSYNIPLRNPQTERLSLQAGYQEEHVEDTDSELYKASVRHIRHRSAGLVQTVFLEINEERFTAGDDKGNSTLLMPGVSWDWSSGDDLIYPKRGWRLGLEVKGGSKALLSDVDFLRGYLRMKRIIPFFDGRLIGRGELGYSLIDDFNELPPSQRFFAGGDNSVRGYGYRELAPRDANDNVVGGRHLLTASIEYDQPIAEKWSLAVFADTGDAFDNTGIQLHHAIGVGVRWRSPVGPIRLDLAHPLDEDQGTIRLHFSLGPDL
ncbi:autotransporter assembly complex protein TamA [Sulfuriflexus mobilis]|uniref:autotransporter assembly complex protein TamA n=1 Tax=Sulfuriflexus mobilis TaxID=1811807 RepID=UPI001559C3B7|nr:autotransporter assembly complex family protein [Sulfuriflexus mobilis]